MANELLTPDIILRESLQILGDHQTFLGMINKDYEKEFNTEGYAKGDEIRIRRPNTYKIRRGRVAQPQETRERYETLKLDQQVGVDVNFNSKELTLELDDFRARILEPAIATLVADIEYACLDMLKAVPMYHPTNLTAAHNLYAQPQIYDWVDRCGRELDIELAPKTDRHALLNRYDESQLIDNLKTLYGDREALSKQLIEGKMGRFQGFSHRSSVHLPFYTPGTWEMRTDLLTEHGGEKIEFNDIPEGATTLPGVNASAVSDWHAGDWVTLSHLHNVHPETKRIYRDTQASFVVTHDAVVDAPMRIWPPIYKTPGTAWQNFAISSAAIAASADKPSGYLRLVALGAGGVPQRQNVYFHKEAFTMACVDLELPRDVDFKARESHNGISMRIVRKYDINEDEFPCRIDVLFGCRCVRPELARRILGGPVVAM